MGRIVRSGSIQETKNGPPATTRWSGCKLFRTTAFTLTRGRSIHYYLGRDMDLIVARWSIHTLILFAELIAGVDWIKEENICHETAGALQAHILCRGSVRETLKPALFTASFRACVKVNNTPNIKRA